MALLVACRGLPVLRDLSCALARRDNPAAWLAAAARASSSASGPGSGAGDASGTPKPGTAEPSAQQPLAPQLPATTAGPQSSAVTSTPVEPPSSAPSTSKPAASGLEDEEWTEVVHTTGQPYYWNQRTGETTLVGEPKPQGRGGRTGSSGSGSGSGSESGSGSTGGGGGAAPRDPRAEAPMEDRTGQYASMGIVVGAFLGWVSQFF
ncbi:hypothetical protein TSOC_012249 [Tetrabaena socialis]|uniref:WW domain-containing protein n=1 Tax=Tetrabaena socialis TaxID=47790 RepID=A0A2J7ZNI5_9CHLO|nr:hypothetical protein TSOC_012249 [Tetrabaena socialis]|eukprot:PNH01832.1 hypothetical protein TSOC_012249 [Tetrabaena socialis]